MALETARAQLGENYVDLGQLKGNQNYDTAPF